ncbi:MAG: fluoride efflux transporter CrcB [Dysgonomonas sp.]|nr:fluoride efflux transporter CrcB [Dysgonomonas sp.]
MIKNILLVGLGGGLGSILRYLTSVYTAKHYIGIFPLPTFIVNILGCIVIGVLIGFSNKTEFLDSEMKLLLITGFCGGYTTFSTFSSENMFLYSNGYYATLIVYVLSSVLLGLLGVYLGTLVSKI